jgi:hypothetical protein
VRADALESEEARRSGLQSSVCAGNAQDGDLQYVSEAVGETLGGQRTGSSLKKYEMKNIESMVLSS